MSEYNLGKEQGQEAKKWLTKKRAVVLLASAIIAGAVAHNKLTSEEDKQTPINGNIGFDTTKTRAQLFDSLSEEASYVEDNDLCPREVCIVGYDKLIPDLPSDRRKALDETLYKIIKRNLGSDDFSVKDAIIREDSVDKNFDLDININYGSFIVDIKSIKQSYLMRYRWSSDWQNRHLAGYNATAECLTDDKLKYGDFDCEDDFSKSNNNLERDPIIKHLPYSTFNYTISANTDKKGEVELNVKMTLFSADTRDGGRDEAISKYKSEVVEWVKNTGLNPNNYPINYDISE